MLLKPSKSKPKTAWITTEITKINETEDHLQVWFGAAKCEFKKNQRLMLVIGKLGYLYGIPEGEKVKIGQLLGQSFKVKIVNNQVKEITK